MTIFNGWGEEFELGQRVWTRHLLHVCSASGDYSMRRYGHHRVIERSPIALRIRRAHCGWRCVDCGARIDKGDLHGSTFYDHYCLDCITQFEPKRDWSLPNES